MIKNEKYSLPGLSLNYKGFTLVELVIVIVILGIITIVAAPRFIELGSDAKRASIKNLASQIKSTTQLVQNKARAGGLRPTSVNPYTITGSPVQTEYLVDFGFGEVEVHYSSLCPESIAEGGDRLNLLDFMQGTIEADFETRIDNRYTLIGYQLPTSGISMSQGCYVIYDSFAPDNCSISVVDVDC
uniref:prepilin-type N-terminal cleavage/methylation domain-containing protein n=1 Tax=Ningiella ruwaisensis TaxID=2364274 RepID=UPI00109F5E7E|nr:prepilin-type N-terminal cleavage/methylation domain-containing protein [Ningiella ruwaisensis]